MRFIVLMSHAMTPRQRDDARATFGVDEFVELPELLKRLWSAIPPELETLEEYLQPVISFLEDSACAGDIILVQGDFGAVCTAVPIVQRLGALPVYATTRRSVVERREGERVRTERVFEHVRFRGYPSCENEGT